MMLGVKIKEAEILVSRETAYLDSNDKVVPNGSESRKWSLCAHRNF
jgi:hypothetical protein